LIGAYPSRPRIARDFRIPYGHDYITKLWRTTAEVILYYVNPKVCGTGQGEARHRKDKRLKLGGGWFYDYLQLHSI
jgi:hypothetical protein